MAATASPKILVSELTKVFPDGRGGERIVLDHVSFAIPNGAFICAVGPSGCGKSTLLNILANLVQPSQGRVQFADDEGTSGKGSRKIAYVFQQPRLLNWLTTRENVEFALQATGASKADWPGRSKNALRMVGLEEFEERFPLQLSGGQQQRVSIARALATNPDVILMDEPFSHLDEITASRLRQELIEIWERTQRTIVFVTHSIPEAVYLADVILVLGLGRLVEEFVVDAPRPRVDGSDRLFEIERKVRQITSRWWGEGHG
jgi:ABC-type nitrate/sulfonate/bicarbonate transport system ATPase subunit